nr:restriction endonuclease subunit S [uncultured Flavobacterium sp.]
MSENFKFKEVVIDKKGFLRGPFGGDLKKEIFVEKSDETYKVYEQGVVLNSDKNIGRYYICEKDYLAKLHKFSVQDKDFLISCSGVNMGAIYQLKEPFERGIINQALLRIRLNNKIINDNYFFYLFKELISKRITSGSGDSTIPNFPALEVIKNIEFELPLLSIQEKVGKIIFDLDAKIKLNNKINDNLEQMAKTLYDYWFVQFDFPDANGKPYKTSGGKMVWNEELKREIPDGWEVNELGQEISIQRGISYKSSEINGEGIPMISLNSFNLDGTYKSEGIKKYSGKYAEKNLVSGGDLLIAITDVTRNADIIGKSIIVPDYYSDLVISMDIAKVIPNIKLTESYLMMLFNSNHYHNYIKWYASGTIVLHLNLDGMNCYKAEIPPKYLLNKFDSIYIPISKRISETKKQNQELASLRDWLLPMLMNGQVSVGEFKEELRMVAEGNAKYGK